MRLIDAIMEVLYRGVAVCRPRLGQRYPCRLGANPRTSRSPGDPHLWHDDVGAADTGDLLGEHGVTHVAMEATG